jgi:hypothetical protein
MNILLFITGHSQLEEYNYFSQFLKKLSLSNACDIYIYCNNAAISPKIVEYYQNFPQENKRLFITSQNAGYLKGGVEAVSNGFEMGIFKSYDYVVHLHPDVFITRDNQLARIMHENLHNDIAFFVNRSMPNNDQFYSFDFFFFKPKLLNKNIFIEDLDIVQSDAFHPEHYLHDMLIKHDVKHTIVKRYDNDHWIPRRIDEHLGLYHEHDLAKVRALLQDNNACITLINGLGDKLLDTIGFCIICKYLHYTPNIIFDNSGVYQWGENNHYDERLFSFSGFRNSKEPCKLYIRSPMPSASLCPYKVFSFIQQFVPSITFEQISRDFLEESGKIIRPSAIITSKIPANVERAYGIHLRRTDKVNNTGDLRHMSTVKEFEIIVNKLLEDVGRIIQEDSEPSFLIVSEEDAWKMEITQIIRNIGIQTNKTVNIIEIDYSNPEGYHNFKSVLDMFSLSKCKEILQGIKYSTFSTIASILGNRKLRNYSNHTEYYYANIIHIWRSVLTINNEKQQMDPEFHKNASHCIQIDNIITNINKAHDF